MQIKGIMELVEEAENKVTMCFVAVRTVVYVNGARWSCVFYNLSGQNSSLG